MSNRSKYPLTITGATPSSVTFAMGDPPSALPPTHVRYGAVRAAKARLDRYDVVTLGGWHVNESDIDALLAAMRGASNRTPYPPTPSPMSAREAWDARVEKLRDRAEQWEDR